VNVRLIMCDGHDSVDSGGWTTSIGTVNEDGICSVTGAVLKSIELSREKEEALMEKVEGLVCTSDDRRSQWNDFKAWLEIHGPFDVVLDGANIGYFGQNFEGYVLHDRHNKRPI
jgi:proteinaceous RNase P